MFKTCKIAYICEHFVVPKIACMLSTNSRKYWALDTFYDFLLPIFKTFFTFIDLSELNIDFLLTFHICIQYEHTLFFGFSGTIL